MTLRILFVSSTVTGGSGKSQRQLAKRLSSQGHEINLLVDDKSPLRLRRKIYEKLTDLEVKVSDTPFHLAVSWLASRMSTRCEHTQIEGVPLSTSYAPENTLPQIVRSNRPDVVVGSSIDRVSWRKITAHCGREEIATVLYLREEVALGHLTVSKLKPDLLLANAGSIADRARALGYDCEMVPSVVELDAVKTSSTSEVALLINPIESHGRDLCLDLAARHPEMPFVLQESWQLSATERADLDDRLQKLPNVEFRERTDEAATIYRDAKVLLVPHRVDNRPRVIAEAQSNGIPVLASDQPGLIESVGQGGLILSADDVDEWGEQLTEVWTTPDLWARLSSEALQHAARDELDPEWVTNRFVELVRKVIPAGSAQS